MRLLLTRNDTKEDGTDGVLTLPDKKLRTLELPWRDNISEHSCIPFGIYDCKRVVSPSFGETFEICDVPSRTNVLFHWGNFKKDTLGCILLGLTPAKDAEGNDIILSSRQAFRCFMDSLSGIDCFELEIR